MDLEIQWSGKRNYEVMSSHTFIVDLIDRICDCGIWEMSSIPYNQAIRCMDLNRDETVVDFLDNNLKMDKFGYTYAEMVNPIPNQVMWPQVHADPLQPSDLHEMSGRPKGSRQKEPSCPASCRKI